MLVITVGIFKNNPFVNHDEQATLTFLPFWQEFLKLPEDRTADDKYQIVEYSAVDYHQPKDNHQSLIINDNVISNNVTN